MLIEVDKIANKQSTFVFEAKVKDIRQNLNDIQRIKLPKIDDTLKSLAKNIEG